MPGANRAAVFANGLRRSVRVLAIVLLLGACVPKPDHTPTRQGTFSIPADKVDEMTARVMAYGQSSGLKGAGGVVGANDSTTYVIHLHKPGLQVIISDPIKKNCFNLNVYKGGVFIRASDDEVDQAYVGLEKVVSDVEGSEFLSETEADALGC